MIRLRHYYKKYISVIIALLVCYFIFWWSYQLDLLPGLHGDEAWFGLKANQFNLSGIDHLYGMNRYTGVLQSILSSITFKLAGVGVCQLRITSAIFNLLALVIVILTFKKIKQQHITPLFLLILAQSALYLISPRVAWEVNTFTLFFISLLIAAVANIFAARRYFQGWWIALFLLINILGAYNHIIFVNISIAALIGYILWSLYNKTLSQLTILALLTLNLVNLSLLYITMQYWIDSIVLNMPFISASLIIVLLTSEILLLKRVSAVTITDTLLQRSWVVLLCYGFLLALMANFIRFHGIALYQIMSNYKVITSFYSYPFSPFIVLLFQIGGGVVCCYTVLFLILDIKHGNNSLFAIFIIAYLGLLPIFTTSCFYRYYLAITAIIGIYLAVKVSQYVKLSIPLLVVLAGMLLITNLTWYKILSEPERLLQAMNIRLGNGHLETSAHFLPQGPLLQFLKEQEIADVYYLTDQFFIEKPIQFYKLIQPWKQIPGNSAVIDYDYSKNNHGGFMFYRKQ
ncbi:hypothetical protein [Chitinophaga ginsengisegetis]|uniref:hypothetical protein n=1 Tax=Chitinophaga ginsengisegetis TaxID=393003 RepID=UPI000DB91F3B|nr:hypothetical protein [Chitinophaga ginsengisegetis]MDR6570731.1 hypothetical protein [Chitinophaga ginsengisegetis]MDR6650465.1 hypothetical protein [Chitinophaga ginsengisegetis]MDR6656896.1 hypothetical protein [Chitinophaga ginsengisegetis]